MIRVPQIGQGASCGRLNIAAGSDVRHFVQ
jgi:hypothetical protein